MCLATIASIFDIGNAKSYEKKKAIAQNQFREKNAEIANDAYIYKTSLENLRLQEESEASAVTLQRENIADMQAQAHSMAQAAETGARGLSLRNLLTDYDRQSAVRSFLSGRNLDLKIRQANTNMKSYRAEALNRINQARPYIQQPYSYTSGILKGASSDVKTVATLSSMGGGSV